MIAAIMQPYFMPYIGYFQLMHAADSFVSLDDAQYIDRGYINRNRIAEYNTPWLTLPVRRGHRHLQINERVYALTSATIASIEHRIEHVYRRARYFDQVQPLVRTILRFEDLNVARFNFNALRILADILDLHIPFHEASDFSRGSEKGQSRIVQLCTNIHANCYINPSGGAHLYEPQAFLDFGIQLCFLRTTVDPGPSGHLSILHLLMTIGVERTRSLLSAYELHDSLLS